MTLSRAPFFPLRISGILLHSLLHPLPSAPRPSPKPLPLPNRGMQSPLVCVHLMSLPDPTHPFAPRLEAVPYLGLRCIELRAPRASADGVKLKHPRAGRPRAKHRVGKHRCSSTAHHQTVQVATSP